MIQSLKSNLSLIHSTLVIIPGLFFLLLSDSSFFTRWGTFLVFSALALFWFVSLHYTNQDSDNFKDLLRVNWIQSAVIYLNILYLLITNALNFRANALGTEFILVTALIIVGLFALTWENSKSFQLIEIIRVAGNPFFSISNLYLGCVELFKTSWIPS